MRQSGAERLFEAIDATWPAARLIQQGAVTLREGKGGGKRVSAATVQRPLSAAELASVEGAMADIGQSPLFMIREGEQGFDQILSDKGYKVVDPVVVLTTEITALTDIPVPRLAAFTIWEPLAIMREIWCQGGIGPARIDVMHRTVCKTAVFARQKQKPAGTGFVAVDGNIAMVHAVEVLPAMRRQGVAGWIMRKAAFWAQEQGADTMVVLCTKANTAALGLYSALGFEPATEYHYRQKPQERDAQNG